MRSHRYSMRQKKSGRPAKINIEAPAVVIIIFSNHAVRGLSQFIGSAEQVDYIIQLRFSGFDKRDVLRLERMVKRDTGPIYWTAASNRWSEKYCGQATIA